MTQAPAVRTRYARMLATAVLASFAMAPVALPAAESPVAKSLDQGTEWGRDARLDFYTRDQGSRIMPLAWMRALREPNGAPFLADGLRRFGYLPNEVGAVGGLPIGFVIAKWNDEDAVGMTCSACHTRQISVKGQAYRVDGGPALADFQRFLTELDTAVAASLASDDSFKTFALAVLGATPNPQETVALRQRLEDWYLPYHTLIERALPTPPWGPGRLDAVSMIFNRLSGLDLGPPPTFIIAGNIQRANAPVRYPFLWNVYRQDRTQWPGFADNGDKILGLSRNLGEVMGVFAVFHPQKDDQRFFGINYTAGSSMNFQGLEDLEHLIRKIGPPKWPWVINRALAAKGSELFAQNCAQGCHEIAKGAFRSLFNETWKTPVINVGTDTREWSILARKVNPGVLTGVGIADLHPPLADQEESINVLGLAVVGTILDHLAHPPELGPLAEIRLPRGVTFTPETESLKGAFGIKSKSAKPAPGSYESRVLQGIWAAAPYLHNGSVPTLAELLKAPEARVQRFSVGPNYDINNVGLAATQSPSAPTTETTGCDQLDSGNSRCGHRFGWKLSAGDKKALIEYLKTL